MDLTNNAVVVDCEHASHFAAQSLPFVGGRIGAQKRKADCLLGLPELTILWCDETSSSPA